MDKLRQYETTPDPFWENVFICGDGDEVMEMARLEQPRWRAIGVWGKDGYDLGRWPHVIVFSRKRGEHYDVTLYVEGDVTSYTTPLKEIRHEIIDNIAFFYWKRGRKRWVRGYKTVEELPEELRGPYRR